MNKYLIFLFVFLSFGCTATYAYDLDISVDEEIKKKYNANQLNYDVPTLPKVEKTTSQTSVPQAKIQYEQTAPAIVKIDKSDAIKINKGTKFIVYSNQTISDQLKIGGIVSFTTTSPVYKKYITIPTGSKITALVVNSHKPQIAGNGGLVILKLTSISYGGKTYEMVGKVTKANSKKIFLNNIKGKHRYWKGVSNQIDKGENFYNKSQKIANRISPIPILGFISIVPKAVGAVGYTCCLILSPVTGISGKGENLSIPSGSNFELKLTEDAYLQ